MTQREQQLNNFLVTVFNDILRLEEASLRCSCDNLSVTELHVLDAIAATARSGSPPTMADLAAKVGVTGGTMTVAVKTLEQKGYALRTRDERDKRRVGVRLTEAAAPVLAAHDAFHEALVRRACARLDEAQTAALCTALADLHTFFTSNDCKGENL